MKKRILSLALALTMCLAIFPVLALAAEVNFIDVHTPYAVSYEDNVEVFPSNGASSVKMAGTDYKNALTIKNTSKADFANFNLGGKYGTLSGVMGAVDGTTISDSYTYTVNFYGDGKLITGFELTPTGLPKDFSVNVTGVGDFRIEVVSPYDGYNIRDYVVGFANLKAVEAGTSATPTPTPPSNSNSAGGTGVNFIDSSTPYAVSAEGRVVTFPSNGASSVTIAGTDYKNVLTIQNASKADFAHFNIDGKYGVLSGVMGAVDGTTMDESYTYAINFYGDGKLITSYELLPTGLPKDFSVTVTGVGDLKIEVVSPYDGNNIRDYTVGFANMKITDIGGASVTPKAKSGGTAVIDSFEPYALGNYVELYPTVGANSVKIAAFEYKNVMTISPGSETASASFNIGGKYSTLYCIIGAEDGTTMDGSYTYAANFYGDGKLISGIERLPVGLPTAVSISVAGVSELKIEVVSPYDGYNIRDYPLAFADLRLDAGSATATPPTTATPGTGSSSGASSWAVAEVDEALALGFVPSELQSDYQQNITRAEFCKLVVMMLLAKSGTLASEDTFINAYNVNLNDTPFTDTSDRYVKIAYSLQIVNGTGNGRFSPASTITRQDAATMLQRAAKVFEFTSSNSRPVDFSDKDSVASYAAPAVDFVSAVGVMSGTGNNMFSPHANYNREQSILTMVRLYKVFPRDSYSV